MMRRSRRTRLGKRLLIGEAEEGGEDREAEVEAVVVSEVGGAEVVVEGSSDSMQTNREGREAGPSCRHGQVKKHGVRLTPKHLETLPIGDGRHGTCSRLQSLFCI